MKLYLENGKEFEGKSVGAKGGSSGEVVFTTGMAGYLETLTDPSYYGQIIVFTYPLIGNYGVFKKEITEFLNNQSNQNIDSTYESEKIWVRGIIMTEVSEEFSHCSAFKSFCTWLKENNIPVLSDIDTREITQILREEGCILGSISDKKPTKFEDPLKGRYVPEVSPKEITILEPKNPNGKTIAFIDCGAKNGIFRNFLKRGIKVIRCPFDQNPFDLNEKFDGIFFSNGPGDPSIVIETIETMKKAIAADIPIFGICLGNQMLGLAAGGKTKKMKYGHRGVNQPCQDILSKKCIITSQNHGFEVDDTSLPNDFEVWFRNLNDNSVEGIRHKTKPIFAVQFHPEACSGPEDGEYLFDEFIKEL